MCAQTPVSQIRIGSGLLILALTLGLGACQPQAPDGGQAEAPADAPAEAADPATPAPGTAPAPGPFAGDLRAVGTEPFWGLSITGGEIVLERPDFPPSRGPNPGFVMEDAQAVWRTQTTDGGDLMVTLRQAPCSDGMSDLTYVYAAEVQSGDETLSGCAGKADAMPREGDMPPTAAAP
ncbi:MAG: hypothetical protein MH112_04310 [Phenylobacterium sp.]|uniref:COG3650 family protein n=1 Tax=Phenylobacterium sp. TaxID=1871053 RepID=UPI0025DB8B6D|nr:hypothetical protein [Phenylobacterium sp.]MCG9915570.1 hypothetical protein [Phenylobacterium sp.]